MDHPLITFTTDFGTGSPYVAEMYGVAMGICPLVRVVDITHGIPAQNVRIGAMVLAQIAASFPPETIHVAVVDPGVGTERSIIAAENAWGTFIAPNNGLLSRVTALAPFHKIVEVAEPRFWRHPVSKTFHGRDIMTPVAAHLASGNAELTELGPCCTDIIELKWPEPQIERSAIVGEVLTVDSFGNLITNIPADMLAELDSQQTIDITCGKVAGIPLVETYGDSNAHNFVALIGSSGWLEIALVNGNAAQELSAQPGTAVQVRHPHVM